MRAEIKEGMNTIDIPEKASQEHVASTGDLREISDLRPLVIQQGFSWQAVGLICACFLLVILTMGAAVYAFHRLSFLDEQLKSTMARVERNIQKLDAGISFDSKRQQLILGLRDEIMKVNPMVSLSEAYEYAELVVRASEKYPAVDPLRLLAIGIVESGYNPLATSDASAKGLYQIWPSTGRMLARALNWEYSDEMLYDPEKNTEMAALYLDILFAVYNDAHLVLAEYNGGPLNAGYFRADSGAIAAETQNYVLKVKGVYEGLSNTFDQGIQTELRPMHKDVTRDGKALGARRGRSKDRTATGRPLPHKAQ